MALLSADIVDDFEAAIEYVTASKVKYASKDRLKLYAFFKQAIIGDNDAEKPPRIQINNRAKWTAWNNLQGMNVEDAMTGYLDLLTSIDPGFTRANRESVRPASSVAGPREPSGVGIGLAELPPYAPPRIRRKPGKPKNKSQELRVISMASGTNPLDDQEDDLKRLQLHERLTKYYVEMDRSRLQNGIGEIVDFGIKYGIDKLSLNLKKKYGLGLDEQEAQMASRKETRIQERETLTKQAQERLASEAQRMTSLEKRLTVFFFHLDPDRLDRGFEELIEYSKARGEKALNSKLHRQYGFDLDADFENRKETESTGFTFSTVPKESNPIEDDDDDDMSMSKLHEMKLPKYVKETLMSFYAKYEPERVRRGDIKVIYEWAERNGLRALDARLKDKYNESLSEFRETSQRLRDELIAFYTKADKSKLVSGLEQILHWGIKNGRRALNEKLKFKYGYNLDHGAGGVVDDDDVQF